MGKINYNAKQIKSVFAQHPEESAIIVTSDGNVFLTKHTSYAKSHCNEFKQEFEELTRAQFEAEEKGGKSKTSSPAAASVLTDWKNLKFGEIIEFAKSKGLEAKTKSTQGKKVLVPEVEAFLATLEVPKVEDSKDGSEDEKEGDDYTPVGSDKEGSKE